MRQTAVRPYRFFAAAAVFAACAGCGSTDVVRSGASEPPQSTSEAMPPAEGELVTSQEALPAEAAYGFADIASSTSDAARAWARFNLQGAPPEVQPETVLLFRGLGESGTCPARFGGLQVEGDEVRFASLPSPPEPSAGERICTSDYRPRTLVISVPAGSLPAGPFRFAGFVLAKTALAHAPKGPSVIDSWIAADPELEVRTEPSEVVVGEQVKVLLTSRRMAAQPGSWATLLERWEGQRWLPAAGSDRHQSHPAVTPASRAVLAGSTGQIALVDTSALPAGEYRVSGRVGLGDAEGSSGVQGFFTVTD